MIEFFRVSEVFFSFEQEKERRRRRKISTPTTDRSITPCKNGQINCPSLFLSLRALSLFFFEGGGANEKRRRKKERKKEEEKNTVTKVPLTLSRRRKRKPFSLVSSFFSLLSSFPTMIASARASTRSACVRGVARSSGSERAAAPRANAAPVARSFSSIGNGALPKSTTINPDIRPVVAASPRRQERSVACSAAAAGASRMFSCLVCPRGTIETARLSPRGGGERDEIVQFLARREKREK